MNVLSLFDGMSCGMIALEKAGVKVTNYFASEIDKHAIAVSKHNYKNIIHIGDVCKVSYKDGLLITENGNFNVGKIDLLIGGSPCQQLSLLSDGNGLNGEKSGLFFQYLRLKNEIQNFNHDLKFLLENVRGKKNDMQLISKLMEVDGIIFDSNLLSAQNRIRYYWTNIEFTLPKDKGILLKDILEEGLPKESLLSPGRLKWLTSDKGERSLKKRYVAIDPIKAGCITARSDASWNSNYVTRGGVLTRLTPLECERLQTVPDGYTSIAKQSERYKMLGNGWTVDVIAHIFKGLLRC